MRRLGALLLAVLAAVAAAASAMVAPADSASTSRVDAIFDTAKGVIPGQLVKIAGARVGVIKDVRLTKDYQARVVMDVPRRFDFHDDASCNIQPEGLISENFVQCDPGTPDKPRLPGEGDDGIPTVPVERTMVPVSITDLFRIFKADVRQRFTVAIAAVGGGLAARGGDINEILRRSNPTLMAVRRLTRDLAAQKRQISAAVRDTDAVIASLARRKDRVRAFVVESERVTKQTADHRTALAEAIRRLPPLLEDTDGAVGNLNRLTRDGRPLLGQLRAAAPGLERVVDSLGPFAAAGRPALRQLSQTADIARRTIRPARPLVGLLRTFAHDALPTGRLLNRVLISLRDRGVVEGLNRFVYYVAAASARYDATSHIIPAHILLTTCSSYAETPAAGCNAFYGGDRAAAATTRRRTRRGAGAAPATPGPAGAPTAAPAPGGSAQPQAPQAIQPVQDLTQKTGQTLDDLADFLLRP